MTNAEWMIKNGYNFADLETEDSVNELKIFLKGNYIGQHPHGLRGFTKYETFINWLDAEHIDPILDDAEKKYLKDIIRPFRSDVTSICKNKAINSKREYIKIKTQGYNSAYLPWYEGGTMYKGMDPDREYTLEELGL